MIGVLRLTQTEVHVHFARRGAAFAAIECADPRMYMRPSRHEEG